MGLPVFVRSCAGCGFYLPTDVEGRCATCGIEARMAAIGVKKPPENDLEDEVDSESSTDSRRVVLVRREKRRRRWLGGSDGS